MVMISKIRTLHQTPPQKTKNQKRGKKKRKLDKFTVILFHLLKISNSLAQQMPVTSIRPREKCFLNAYHSSQTSNINKALCRGSSHQCTLHSSNTSLRMLGERLGIQATNCLLRQKKNLIQGKFS